MCGIGSPDITCRMVSVEMLAATPTASVSTMGLSCPLRSTLMVTRLSTGPRSFDTDEVLDRRQDESIQPG